MENTQFKTAAFGGFDKQNVIEYIEKTSREHTEALEALRAEAEQLRAERDALAARAAQQETRLGEQEQALAQRDSALSALQAETEQLKARAADRDALQKEAEELSGEVNALRPDAEAYRQFRTRIGDIECEARKRAADLEASVHTQLQERLEGFRERYQTLVTSFGSASVYVTGELRKVEVNLSQLPLALDRIGADLKELEATLTEK